MRTASKVSMTTAVIIITLIITAVCLRWPRLEPGMHSITCARDEGNSIVVEFRGMKPFGLVVKHVLQEALEPVTEMGVTIHQPETYREEEIVVFPSTYDWLRDEHYLRVRATRGDQLSVRCGKQVVNVSPWSVPDATQVAWNVGRTRSVSPSGTTVISSGGLDTDEMFGDGGGAIAAYFARTQAADEYLLFIANTRERAPLP